jgi:hypothetical protein
MDLFSSSLASVRKIFRDTFNRANRTGLGTASDGSSWTAVKETFNIVSNKAEATTPNHAIATVDMPTENNEISIYGISQGAAASLWVTDSGNWWTIGTFQDEVDCNCQTCFNCEAYSGTSCIAFGVAAYNPAVYGITAYNAKVNGIVAYNATTWGVVSNNATVYGVVSNNAATYGITSYNPRIYGQTGNNPTLYRITGGGNARTWRKVPAAPVWQIATWNPRTYGVLDPPSPTYGQTGGGTARYGITANANPNYGVTANANPNYGVTANQNPNYGVTANQNPNYGKTGGENANFQCVSSNPNVCTSQFNYDCNCQTCYPQYIRILQSVGATVSTVFSWLIGTISSPTIIQSLRVKTQGNQITVKAYSDPSLVTQVGDDLVYTATGATISTNSGIAITPSDYNQGLSIDSVEIKRSDL